MAVNNCSRWNGDTGLLQIRNNPGVYRVALFAAISKTHDVELNRGSELKLLRLFHEGPEILSKRAGSRNYRAQFRGAVDLKREPRFERAEAPRQIRPEIARPRRTCSGSPRLSLK